MRSQTAAKMAVDIISKKIDSAVDADFSLGKTEGDLLSGLTISDITISTPDRTWLKVSEAFLRYDPFPLIIGLFHLNEIRFNGVELFVINNNNQSLSLPFIRKNAGGMSNFIWGGLGRADRYSLTNAAIYELYSADGPASGHAIKNITLQGQSGFSALPGPFNWSVWCDIQTGSADFFPLGLHVNLMGDRIIFRPERLEINGLRLQTSNSKITLDMNYPWDRNEQKTLSWDAPRIAMAEWGWLKGLSFSTSGSISTKPPPPQLMSKKRGGKFKEKAGRRFFQIEQQLKLKQSEFTISGNIIESSAEVFDFLGTIDFKNLHLTELETPYRIIAGNGKNECPAVSPAWIKPLKALDGLSGSLFLNWKQLFSDTAPRPKGTLRITGGQILGVDITQGCIPFSINNSIISIPDAKLATAAGILLFSISNDQPDAARPATQWTFDTQFNDFALNMITGRANLPDCLNGSAKLIWKDSDFQGDLQLKPFTFNHLNVSGLHTQFIRDERGFEFKTLDIFLDRNKLNVTGGVFSEKYDLAFSTKDLDAQILVNDLEGKIDILGSLTGELRQPLFKATIHAKNLSNNFFGAASAQGNLLIEDLFGKPQASWRWLINKARIGDTIMHQVDIKAVEKETGEITITKMDARGSEADWALGSPAVVKFGKNSLNCRNFSISSGDRFLTTSINWVRGEEFLANISLNDLPISPFISLQSPFSIPAGLLSAEIKATGRADALSSELVLKFAATESENVYTMSATGHARDDRLHFTGTLETDFEKTVQLAFDVPLVFSLDPLQMQPDLKSISGTMRIDNIDITGMKALDRKGYSGLLSADISFSPSASGNLPRLGGKFAILDADFSLPGTSLSFAKGRGRFSYDGKTISTEGWHLEGEKGSLAIDGEMDVSSEGNIGDLDLILVLDSLFLSRPNDNNARLSGSLQVEGTLKNPFLEGDLTVLEGNIYTSKIGSKLNVSKDVTIYESRMDKEGSQASDYFSDLTALVKNIGLNVSLNIPGSLRLHADKLELEFQGALQAKNNEKDGFLLTGFLKPVSGGYKVGGREFTIKEGMVRLNEHRKINPKINAKALCRMPGLDISAIVSGTVNDPKIVLTSDPVMSKKDIIASFLFGRPIEKIPDNESGQFQGDVATLFGRTVLDRFRDFTGNRDLLESLSLYGGTSDNGEGSVGVGKYLSDDLLLSYEYMLGQEAPGQLHMEYNMQGGFSIESQVQDEEKTGLDLFWKKDF